MTYRVYLHLVDPGHHHQDSSKSHLLNFKETLSVPSSSNSHMKFSLIIFPTDKQLIAPPAPIERTCTQNIKITHKITLGDLYSYPLGAIVEYPETSCHKPVGHLFEISPVEWVQPKLSFAYSLGAPMGQVETRNDQPIYCNLLVDKDGERVPCRVSHATCKPKLLFFAKY